jgi:hypothetical protein
MTNTVELRVDGERIEIEIEPLTQIEKMLWAGKAPDTLIDGSADVSVSEELVEFLIDLTTSRTILNRKLLNDLPQRELNRLMNAAVVYSFDEDADFPERGAEEYTEDTSIDWNEDGSIDLYDWR